MPESIFGLPSETILGYGLNIVAAIVIFIIGMMLANWASKLTMRATRQANLDRTIGQVLSRLVRTVVIVVTILVILNRFGFETASLIALLGAAGLAIGLALQGTLNNIAAGVMLLALRPFKLGDLVEVGGNLGIVQDIGLFVTRLDSLDNVAIHMPNANIWGSEVKNLSQNPTRRVDMTFGIGYGDDMDKAISIIKEVLASNEHVLETPAPDVFIAGHGASSIDLWVRPWCQNEHYWNVYFSTHKQIKESFDKAGIEIPFPQRDVHIYQEATN